MSYGKLSLFFHKVKDKNVREVGDLIGGKVKMNTDSGIFRNACAIRLSYALNKAGYAINKSDGAVSSGSDNKWYLYRVKDIINYANKIAKEVLKGDQLSDFNGKRGIIVFGDCNWNDATGHVDLFDGTRVEGNDYARVCNSITLYIL